MTPAIVTARCFRDVISRIVDERKSPAIVPHLCEIPLMAGNLKCTLDFAERKREREKRCFFPICYLRPTQSLLREATSTRIHSKVVGEGHLIFFATRFHPKYRRRMCRIFDASFGKFRKGNPPRKEKYSRDVTRRISKPRVSPQHFRASVTIIPQGGQICAGILSGIARFNFAYSAPSERASRT